MTIDHTGNVFLNDFELFRFLGRIAFPVFGFLLVEGFNHTKDDKKRYYNYLFRILILALITETFYDKLFFDKYIYLGSQNILFTLFTALICMKIYDTNKENIFHKIESVFIVIYIGIIIQILSFDYGLPGIFLIFNYYLISQYNKNKFLLYIINTILYMMLFSFFYKYSIVLLGVLLSLIPICFYNSQKGYNSKFIQYAFYLYYPLHIIVMLIIKTLT